MISMMLRLVFPPRQGVTSLKVSVAAYVAVEFVVETSWDCFGYFDLRIRLSTMGEPLSPDRMFNFPMDEPEPKHVYDFFAPGPLPGYADNPNNTNRWIEADVPLLGEPDEPLGAEEDLAMLFGDDDFSNDGLDDNEDDEEVWEMNEEWLMAPVTPPPMPVMPPPSTYKVGCSSTAVAEGHSLTLLAPRVPVPPLVIEDLRTRMGNLEYGHGQLVKKVIIVSDAEVMSGVEQGQQAATQRDETIAGLSQQCILGFDRRLADVEKRPPGPQ
ncbi:hypothetical protein Tco_1420995 [Tanacetum coccineum]